MKKRGMSIILIILCFIPLRSAYAGDISQIIYRVYVNDQMIGVLSDIAIYEEYEEKKIESYLNHYKLEDLIIPDNVRIEQEVTYIPHIPKDEEVINYIDENVKFKTKGYYVKVGSANMCVKDVTEVEKEIESLFQLYISESDLKRVKDTNLKIEPLMTEGEQVIGIKFSPSVEYSSSICNIDDLVTKQEIGNLILTGEKDPVKVGILENDSTIETLASLNDLKYNQ